MLITSDQAYSTTENSGPSNYNSNRNSNNPSLANTPSIENQKNSQFLQRSTSANTFQINNQNLQRNPSQSTVYVIPANNRASIVPFPTDSGQEDFQSIFGGSIDSRNTPYAQSNNQDINKDNSPAEDENIIVDQNSRLGILVQIKVLEDKV